MANKICKIVISNFKGITYQTVLTKDKPELIFGKNGSGKTSIIEALRFGLLGKMPKDMIYHGAGEGFVSIFFNDMDNTVVTRLFFAGDKPNKVKVNSKVTTAKEAQKIICEIMGCSEEKLDVLTSTSVFHELINGDLGKFLLSFITEPMTREKLYSLVEFTDAEKTKLNTDDLLPKKFDVSELGAVYLQLFAERTELKRTIASYEAKFDFETVYPEPHYKNSDELRKAEELYIEARGKAKAISDSVKAYEKAVDAYNVRVEKKSALEIELSKSVYVPEATEESVEELDTAIRALVKEKHSFETIIASNTVVVNNQKKILEALDSDVCPIASCLKCKTDKTAAKSSIEEALNAASKAIDTANENIKSLSERIDADNGKLKTLKDNLANNRKISELKRRISDIDVGEPPEMPILSVAETDDWKMFPMYKQEYEEYVEFSDAKEAYLIMVNKLSMLNRLIKSFSAKGEVNSAIMSHYCDLFNEEAEPIASLFNYTVNFVPENGVKLSLIPKDKKVEVDFSSLSTGEKLITSIIIYVVLNSLIGTGIIILDDFNDLDVENAAIAKDILMSVYSDLGMTTIFVAGCNEVE